MKRGSKKIIDKTVFVPVPPKTVDAVQPVLFDLPPIVSEEPENYKVPDVIFWEAIRNSYGIFARAARWLKKEHDIDITRQAIQQRANLNKELLNECREGMIDLAEEVIVTLLTQTTDKKVRADMAKHVTKTLGKGRGYSEKNITAHEGEIGIRSVTVEHVPVDTPFAASEKDIDDTK